MDHKEEKILWHYTSPEVLPKFAQEIGEIYATHHKFLNDRHEIDYGKQIFDEWLTTKCPEYNDDLNNAKDLPDLHVFMLCFSENGDNLYQWRSYTPNGGYAVGFSGHYFEGMDHKYRNNIEKMINEQGINENNLNLWLYAQILDSICFFQCIYDKNDIDTEIEKRVNKFKALKNPNKAITNEVFKMRAIKVIRDYISYIAKNSSFHMEQEWRIIISKSDLHPREITVINKKPRIDLNAYRDISPLSEKIRRIYVSPHGGSQNLKLLASMLFPNIADNIIISKSSYCG